MIAGALRGIRLFKVLVISCFQKCSKLDAAPIWNLRILLVEPIERPASISYAACGSLLLLLDTFKKEINLNLNLKYVHSVTKCLLALFPNFNMTRVSELYYNY